MDYFSNKEVLQKYNISEPTLFKWLKNSQLNKNNLVLEKVKKSYKIVKNQQNFSELEKLALEAKKFRNSIAFKEITPKPEFYDLFSKRQIIEIINDLETKREINLKFSYFDDGAKVWDKQANDSKNYNVALKNSQILLNSIPFLVQKIASFSKVNIIDIGPGNGLSTVNFVKHFHENNLLNKYIAVDISPEMNNLANETFDFISFKSYIRDIEELDIKDICFENKNENTVNLLLILDVIGNIDNDNHVWSNLRMSLDSQDILIVGNKMDRGQNKTDFTAQKKHSERYLNLPNMLNLNIENPILHFSFNEAKNARCGYLELDKDYLLKIDKVEIELHKGELIEIWMHRMSTIKTFINDVYRNKLDLVQLTTEKDGNLALVVCQAN